MAKASTITTAPRLRLLKFTPKRTPDSWCNNFVEKMRRLAEEEPNLAVEVERITDRYRRS
jgi:hypothetical protein